MSDGGGLADAAGGGVCGFVILIRRWHRLICHGTYQGRKPLQQPRWRGPNGRAISYRARWKRFLPRVDSGRRRAAATPARGRRSVAPLQQTTGIPSANAVPGRSGRASSSLQVQFSGSPSSTGRASGGSACGCRPLEALPKPPETAETQAGTEVMAELVRTQTGWMKTTRPFARRSATSRPITPESGTPRPEVPPACRTAAVRRG